MKHSVAIAGDTYQELSKHLLRDDGQEDLCFALWYPSYGKNRTSALVQMPIFPRKNERFVHGNAGFAPDYVERVLQIANDNNAGLAFLHSHLGPGWQDMSSDDIRAEQSLAARVKGATGQPLLGLTMGTDGSLSARFWHKTGPRKYERFWCESVRVLGDHGLEVTFMDLLLPPPRFRKRLERTITAWGPQKQQKLARLKVGVVGAGSVGSIIAESLARMGVTSVKLIDFDFVEEVNLDRLLHATERDIGKAKVDVLADKLKKSATAENFNIEALPLSIVEEEGYRQALDCDILFSCVDRPWPRSVLNLIAFAHLIPVIDGGIAVRVRPSGSLQRADWKAHTVYPGRKCLECLGQYDPALVSAEREGYFEDPDYIKSLPTDHFIKQNQNVFAFSLDVASSEILQMLSIVIAPFGIANIGARNYHFVTGDEEITKDEMCHPDCIYSDFIARGESLAFKVTGNHLKAEYCRQNRHKRLTFLDHLQMLIPNKKRPN